MEDQNQKAPAAAKVVLGYIENLSPIEMVQDPKVSEKFMSVFSKIHRATREQAEAFYAAESLYFTQQLKANKDLLNCTRMSLYGCWLDVAINGLSFAPAEKNLYILSRKFYPNNQDKSNFENRAYIVISPYGELRIRMQSGQISHADNPILVYEGDKFSPKIENDQKRVVWEMKYPRQPGAKIIGAFIKITRADGSIDFSWLLQEDMDRLKGYSSRQNYGKANALYGNDQLGIDSGFLLAKTIKHAFKSYPKIRIGEFSMIEDEEELNRDNYLPPADNNRPPVDDKRPPANIGSPQNQEKPAADEFTEHTNSEDFAEANTAAADDTIVHNDPDDIF